MKLNANAAIALATGVTAIFTTGAHARADDEAPGWGDAIAARVIGEKCPNALKATEIDALNAYISDAFQQSMSKSTQGPAWWADLRDKLEQSYVEKYSDPENCTDDAKDQAEDMVSDVRDAIDDKK